MPRQNGFEATRKIRELSGTCASLPIVAVSADAFESTRRQSEAAGCDAFITKPLHLDAVLAAIETQLRVEWVYAVDLPSAPPLGACTRGIGPRCIVRRKSRKNCCTLRTWVTCARWPNASMISPLSTCAYRISPRRLRDSFANTI